MTSQRAVLFAAVSGLVLGCAYPPVGLGFLAYVSLVPMLYVVKFLPSKRVWMLAFFSGLLFHIFTVAWLRNITWIGAALAIVTLAAIYALSFVVARWAYEISPRYGLFCFPFAVAGIEWARSFDLLAFPWVILGNSQAYYIYLVQFADITSVFGVSWWVVMVNVMVFMLLVRRSVSRVIFLVLLFLVPFGYSMMVIRSGDSPEKTLNVALIQGNVLPDDKWEAGSEEWNLNLYRTMSIEAMAQCPDLIVWPETAIPVYLNTNHWFRYMVQSFVDSIGVPLLTGMPANDYGTGKKWNSAGFFQPGEDNIQQYNKLHLVPFGEAIPLDDYFPRLRNLELGQANWDKGTDIVVFKSPVIPPFNVAICFESIFPDLIRKFVRRGAEFITVVTNDVWFGPQSSPIQHAMIAVFRAIEFHRPVVRCANTGISMLIDSYGRVIVQSGAFERTIVTGSIHPDSGTTLYLRYGNIFSMFCLGITVMIPVAFMYLKFRARRGGNA